VGDVRVIHQGQSLLFSFKPGDNPFGVHPRFDELDRHLAFNGPLLLGQVYDSHVPFTKDIKKLVTAAPGSRLFQ